MTERQKEIYSFLKKFYKQNGYYASQTDLKKQYGFTYQTAQHYMKLFTEKGLIKKTDRGRYKLIK